MRGAADQSDANTADLPNHKSPEEEIVMATQILLFSLPIYIKKTLKIRLSPQQSYISSDLSLITISDKSNVFSQKVCHIFCLIASTA